MKINVPIKVNITNKDIYYILASAIEGGINYWCDKYKGEPIYRYNVKTVECSWEWLIYGGSLTFFADDEKHTLTRDLFEKGFQMWIDRHGKDRERLVHYDSKTNRFKFIGDLDAGDADSIIQYGVFGKIVYG